MEAHLSQFTLTKIVNISPYYMLVNETEVDTHTRAHTHMHTFNTRLSSLLQTDLYVAETADRHNTILLPPGEVRMS